MESREDIADVRGHALEAYRSRVLGFAQLRRLLGFELPMQGDAFLKEHGIYDYSVADFEQDRETLRELRSRWNEPPRPSISEPRP